MTYTAACFTQLRKNQPVVLKFEGLQTPKELIADEDVMPFEMTIVWKWFYDRIFSNDW